MVSQDFKSGLTVHSALRSLLNWGLSYTLTRVTGWASVVASDVVQLGTVSAPLSVSSGRGSWLP